jgi:light-regulated signal transduction histidine kinase (bacteriophytochrome)
LSKLSKAPSEVESPPDPAELIADEYREFVRIVSHDLSAPLRHVREFTRMLIAGRRDGATADEQEYIKFIELALKRLADMQEALLAFSRVNTHRTPLVLTDCNELVAAALGRLDEVISARPTKVECGELPVVMADAPQIQAMFFYLLDNALKFHPSDSPERKIAIAASEEDGMYRFDVTDNGIGIGPSGHQSVFHLFQRLNHETWPGIGAGLTLARKIVERHDGRMQIDSVEGAGTTVSFWLPR